MLEKNKGKVNVDVLVMSVLIFGCAYFFLFDQKKDNQNVPSVVAQNDSQSVVDAQPEEKKYADKMTQVIRRSVVAIRSVFHGKPPNLDTEVEKVNKVNLLSLQAKQHKWKSSRGYFYLPDYQRYDGFKISQLKKKVSDGDILAMSVLIRKYKKAGRKSKVKGMALHSAAHGATAELIILVREYGERALDTSLTTKVRLVNLENMLTFAELAAIRGDKKGIKIGLSVLDRSDLELTRFIFKRSFARSWDLYYYILGKNSVYNLAAFNNSADALTVSKVDQKLKLLPNSYGWAKKHIETFVQ